MSKRNKNTTMNVNLSVENMAMVIEALDCFSREYVDGIYHEKILKLKDRLQGVSDRFYTRREERYEQLASSFVQSPDELEDTQDVTDA